METIKVGILNSLTGFMSRSETPMVKAAKLAIETINKQGGVLGHKIEPVVEDGESTPSVFAEKAKNLIYRENISTIFGVWNSNSRKAVKAVLEKSNAVLWYPVQYEGFEESPNIFYTGTVLNQQFVSMLNWCISKKFRSYFLIGSDYVYPKVANKFINAYMSNRKESVVLGEEYYPTDCIDFKDIASKIKNLKPNVIINTLNGDSNKYFFNQLKEAGVLAKDIPVISTSIGEIEYADIGEAGEGHYAVASYFQNLDSATNKKFVKEMKEAFGADSCVSDQVAMSYAQVFVWKEMVEKVGSFNLAGSKSDLAGNEFDTVVGKIKFNNNNHFTKKVYIGQVKAKGNIEIVDTTEMIEPLPWQGVESLDADKQIMIKDILNSFSENVNVSSLVRKKIEASLSEDTSAQKESLSSYLGEIKCQDVFNLDELQQIQDSFSKVTGVASIITDKDGTPITKPSNFSVLCSEYIRKTDKGMANCKKSDAIIGKGSDSGPVIKRCLSAGLWDAGAAIKLGDKHIANWLIGQVRDESQTEEQIKKYAQDIYSKLLSGSIQYSQS